MCGPQSWQLAARLLITVEEAHLVWFLVCRFDVLACRPEEIK